MARLLAVLTVVAVAVVLLFAPPEHRDLLALTAVPVVSAMAVWLVIDEVRLRRKFPQRDSWQRQIEEAREREREAQERKARP